MVCPVRPVSRRVPDAIVGKSPTRDGLAPSGGDDQAGGGIRSKVRVYANERFPPGAGAMIRTIRAFATLPRRERAVVMRACALYPLAGIGLRSFGMRRTQGLLRSAASVLIGASPTLDAKRIAHLVERTADGLQPRPKCLARSLVLEAMLLRAGLPAILHLGARRAPTFEAHAWVELDGETLNDDTGLSASFSPFAGRPAVPPPE